MCILPSIGDGSCMYHSIAQAIVPGYYHKSRSDQTKIGRYLRQQFKSLINEQMYANTVEVIQKEMKKNGISNQLQVTPFSKWKHDMNNHRTWADLLQISIFGLRMRLNLVFYNSRGKQFYYGVSNFKKAEQENLPTVLIEWERLMHFNLICKQNTDEHNNTTIQRQFFYPKDKVLLNRIKTLYNHAR